LEKGGKGGFLKLINPPKDTPLSLRRGVFITKEFISKDTFKHPPVEGGEIIDPLSPGGRG